MPTESREADRYMSPFDALLYRGDVEPATRSMLAAACLLDRPPGRRAFIDAVDRASRLVLRLRQRVVAAPVSVLLPVWAVDPDFDLSYHLRFLRADAPGSFEQLLGIVQQEVMRPLDQARPLWEMILVEGLAEDRAAVIIKMSHAISDGVGIVRLFTALFDEQQHPDRGPMPPAPIPEDITPDDVVERALKRLPRALARTALRSSGAALALARQASDHSGPSLAELRAYVGSLQRMVKPGAEPSPVLRGRSLARRCIAFEIPLAQIKQAGQRLDASVNDVYLAGVIGALRRYHLGLGVAPAPIPMAIPVNLRSDTDQAAGNRFGVVTLAAPLDVADVARRLAIIKEQVRSGRKEPAVGAPAALANAFCRLPDWLRQRLAAQAPKPDVQASNVPGSPVPVYLAGSRLERVYAFGPVPGVAAMIALQSLAGTCSVAVNLDPAAITDLDLFMTSLHEGFAEVLPKTGRGRGFTAPTAGSVETGESP